MRTVATFLGWLLLVGVLTVANRAAGQNNDKNACPVIEQALRDYQEVKSAGTRREVARYFIPDGGMQFPAKTRYVYSKCSYLHVDVEFELVKPAEISTLPDDRVISVSKLYVDYPAKD